MGHKGVTVLGGSHRLLAEHALAGAGRINQHPVKLPGQGFGKVGGVLVCDNGVRHAHPLQILAQDLGAGGHKLIRQQQALPLQGCRKLAGFSTGRSTEVRHPHAGAHIKQGGGGRCARLLRIEQPRMVPRVPPRAEVCRRGERSTAEF